jgi:amidohydrolase
MQTIVLRRRIRDAFVSGCAVLAVVTSLGAGKPATTVERIDQVLESRSDNLIELRRDLHRHPEVAGEEERTARVIADHLRALGLEVSTGVGGHGVVGLLRGDRPGPVVAYRADMDAMATPAPDPVAFASENPGVRHICGHDVHVTVALGIAEVLAAVREDLGGTVKFLFQPAEETAEGARQMIASGALADPVPDAIYAVHCAPLPTGQFGSRAGVMLPGLDVVELTLSGDGDLAAAAEKCSQVIAAVSTTAGMSPPQGAGNDGIETALVPGAFISAGAFRSEADGDRWSITGMVRASSDAMHTQAKHGIEDGFAALDLPGVTYELNYTERAIAAVNNDAELVGQAEAVIRKLGGDQALLVIDELTPFFSEDFSFFQREVPGVLLFLGVSNDANGQLGLPHHPMFVADEDAIAIGVRTMSMVMLDFLECP